MTLENTLRLQRFCGHEVYAVQKGEVFVKLPGEGEQGVVLNLEFHSGALIEGTTPENERGDEPTLEVNLPLPSLTASELVGKTIRVKKALDQERGTWNRIYVFEHEDLREIAATFVEISDNECRLSLTARTQDPNHYDGSKPETIVKLEGWFPLAKFHEAAKSVAPPPPSAKPASVKPAPVPPATAAPKQASATKRAPAQGSKAPSKTAPAAKTAPRKAPAKKAPPKKAPPKKAPAKPTRKAPAQKVAPKKAPPKKVPPKKSAPKKSAPKKSAPKKVAPKKSARKA